MIVKVYTNYTFLALHISMSAKHTFTMAVHLLLDAYRMRKLIIEFTLTLR
jgi:hypothetical protein